MATTVGIRYGVPMVKEDRKSIFSRHLLMEEMIKTGVSGTKESGRITISIAVDTHRFGSDTVRILSRFGGDTTQNIRQFVRLDCPADPSPRHG